MLEERFNQPQSKTLQTLHSLRYTVHDARYRTGLTAYVSEIVAAAQACNHGANEYSLVLYAWSHLDIEFREAIVEPPADITIPTFIKLLRRKQVSCFDSIPAFQIKRMSRNRMKDIMKKIPSNGEQLAAETKIKFSCRRCKETFASNTKPHRHLQECPQRIGRTDRQLGKAAINVDNGWVDTR